MSEEREPLHLVSYQRWRSAMEVAFSRHDPGQRRMMMIHAQEDAVRLVRLHGSQEMIAGQEHYLRRLMEDV